MRVSQSQEFLIRTNIDETFESSMTDTLQKFSMNDSKLGAFFTNNDQKDTPKRKKAKCTRGVLAPWMAVPAAGFMVIGAGIQAYDRV
jgi:hypothetical protein